MATLNPAKRINWAREKNGTVRIFECGTGGAKWPRAKCHPFDTYTDEQLEGYIQNYNAKIGIQSKGVGVAESTAVLIEEWAVFLKLKDKNRGTVAEKRKHAYRCSKYFETLTDDIKLWPQYSIDLATHLRKEGHSKLETAKTQNNLRSFWAWLKKHKKRVSGALDLDEVTGYAIQQTARLSFSVTPEDVLEFVKSCTIPEIKIAALTAFFGGLRPHEVYALRRGYFHSKDFARNSESGKVMASIGLYDGLVVNVSKSRGKKIDEEGDPKKLSFGIVSIFDKRAAAELVKLIGDKPKDQPLFKYTNGYYQHLWNGHGDKPAKGYPGLTLWDLRRAGVYYLGNFSQIKIESLKNWARHKKISTTALYFRQPYAAPKPQDVLELDDVG